MSNELSRLIKKVYAESGVPSILRDDYAPLYGLSPYLTPERYIHCFCNTFEIPSYLRPVPNEAREFVHNVARLTWRWHTIQKRGFEVGVEVRYDSVPSHYDIYVIRSVTNDNLVKLDNGRLCEPLWLEKIECW